MPTQCVAPGATYPARPLSGNMIEANMGPVPGPHVQGPQGTGSQRATRIVTGCQPSSALVRHISGFVVYPPALAHLVRLGQAAKMLPSRGMIPSLLSPPTDTSKSAGWESDAVAETSPRRHSALGSWRTSVHAASCPRAQASLLASGTGAPESAAQSIRRGSSLISSVLAKEHVATSQTGATLTITVAATALGLLGAVHACCRVGITVSASQKRS